jgi:hypothetical protein
MLEISAARSDKIQRFARLGEWAASLALCLLLAVFTFWIYALVTSHPDLRAEMIEDFSIGQHVSSMTMGQSWFAFAFWVLVDIAGLLFFWTARRLFQVLRRGGIFTETAASLLRRIGWIIMSLGPISILSKMIGGALVVAWATGSELAINLTIDDADIYALVIGLVIVVFGQIMFEATRIADENRSFV